MSFGSLWLPVLLSGIATWVAAALAWMVLPHHRSDFRQLPDEDGVLAAMRKSQPTPGQYAFPHCDRKNMGSEAMKAKRAMGPIGVLRVIPSGEVNMGKALGTYFAWCLAVAFLTAYVLRHSLPAGAPAIDVARIGGTAAIGMFVMAAIPESIWGGRPWKDTFKSVADGVAYGLITGAIFAWLWPAA